VFDVGELDLQAVGAAAVVAEVRFPRCFGRDAAQLLFVPPASFASRRRAAYCGGSATVRWRSRASSVVAAACLALALICGCHRFRTSRSMRPARSGRGFVLNPDSERTGPSTRSTASARRQFSECRRRRSLMMSDDLSGLWRRFEGWLAEHASGDHAALRAGASNADFSRLEAGLGFPVHDDVREVLRLHNGVIMRRGSMEPGAFLLGYSLLDVDCILEAHRELVTMVEDAREDGDEDVVVGKIADAAWVPFARDLGGDMLFIDHRDGLRGEVCEISFGDPSYRTLWPSMRLMMEALCTSVESGRPLASLRVGSSE